MDVRRLGTRGIANLAYTILLDARVAEAIEAAEDAAVKRKGQMTSEDRRTVIAETERAFDEELTLEAKPGVDPARIRAARENARALRALMRDMDLAATAE